LISVITLALGITQRFSASNELAGRSSSPHQPQEIDAVHAARHDPIVEDRAAIQTRVRVKHRQAFARIGEPKFERFVV